jgi:hypothetical protein
MQQLTPTPLPTALSLLLVSEARVSALVRPAFGLGAAPEDGQVEGGQPEGSGDNDGDGGGDGDGDGQAGSSSSSSSSARKERSQKRAVRVRYDLDNARSLLEQVGWVLDKWDAIPAARKAMVEVRELAAVFGAGAVVFNCVEDGLRELARLYEVEALDKAAMEKAEGGCEVDKNKDVVRWLRHDVRGELWEMMRGLKDLATAVWCVMMILERWVLCTGPVCVTLTSCSPSNVDAETSRENLRAAVAGILAKENELSKEIKRLYPDPEIGLGCFDQADAGSVSVSDGSSIGQNTPRTSIDYRSRPSSEARTIIFLDDSDDSDSEDGLPTPTSSEFPFPDTAMEGRLATLADISRPDDGLIPVAESPDPTTPNPNLATPNLACPQSPQRDSSSLKVITVSTTGVDISPFPEDLNTPSLPQPTANTALSADTVFQLPEITDEIVLDFFYRALEVSRFAARFPTRNRTQVGSVDLQPSQQKLRNLSPRQIRELSTDLYDELVRRNVEDQNKGKRSIAERKRFIEPQMLDIKRLYARGKLAKMGDGQLAGFIAVVLAELESRCQPPDPPVRESFKGARLSAVLGARWLAEAVPEALEGQMSGSAILDSEALKRIENRKRFMRAK